MATNGTKFTNWVVGISAVLVVLGVVAAVTQSSHANTRLAVIDERQEHLQKSVDSLLKKEEERDDELEATKVTVKALQLLLEPHNENHAAIRKELAEIQASMKEYERLKQGGG